MWTRQARPLWRAKTTAPTRVADGRTEFRDRGRKVSAAWRRTLSGASHTRFVVCGGHFVNRENAGITHLPYDDLTFDAVVCSFGLLHFQEPTALFARLDVC
jgi:hypothetical protein